MRELIQRQPDVMPAIGLANRSVNSLQRKCDCGGPTSLASPCASCSAKQESDENHVSALSDEQAFGDSTRSGHDFSRYPVISRAPLTVSEPGDALEAEADRVAEHVVRSNAAVAPAAQAHGLSGASSVVQRQEESGVEASDEDDLEEMADETEDMEILAGGDEEDEASPDDSTVEEDPTGQPKLNDGASTRGQSLRVALPAGGGRPLDTQVRGFMEQRIGHDFSRVRIHTDQQAVASARRLQAQAFTLGSDVYFNQGRYMPATHEGQKLLAHELAHVVQQTGDGRSVAATESATIQCQPERGRRGQRGRTRAPAARRCKKRDGRDCAAVCGPRDCDGNCAPAVVRNRAGTRIAHNPCCGNETCPGSGPVNPRNFIRRLSVNLSTQMVVAEMSRGSVVGPFLSSPHPSHTPRGLHTIEAKCGPCHTNCDGDGMAWLAGFAGIQYGFHNSQRVARGTHSHGCVRVPCARARWIHDNSSSGVTRVCVHTGADCGRRRPSRPTPTRQRGGGRRVSMTEGSDSSADTSDSTETV